MSFWVFYLLALLPLSVGGLLFVFDKEINWIEYVGASVFAFVLAGVFHMVSIGGMTDDIETWSGQIVQGKHEAAWDEYYEQAIYRTEYYTTTEHYTTTDSKGHSHGHTRTVTHSRQVFDHWEPRTRHHDDTYGCWSNINTSYGLDANSYLALSKRFADNHPVPGHRTTSDHNSRMIGGDPNDYVADNKTGWIQPITDRRHFENRIKAAPSVFSFPPIPATIKPYAYPTNDDPWRSDRLIGSAALLDALSFDQMNSRLGPTKKVNVILIGAGAQDSFFSQWQEAAYIRGRKNDIVITYGGPNTRPTWCRVFSWGEGRALKAIESIVMDKGVTNDIIPLIESEIKTGFTRADWKKWDYLTIEIAPRYVWWYLGVMLVTQCLIYVFAHRNSFDKRGDKNAWGRRPANSW